MYRLNCPAACRIFSSPGGSDGKDSACNARDLGSIPKLGRSPGEGNGYPLQYSCLENSLGREAWQATVHGVTKSQTLLSNFHLLTYVRSEFLNQGSNPCPCTVRWTPNHWVTREVPCLFQFSLFPFLCVLSSLLMIWHRGHAC